MGKQGDNPEFFAGGWMSVPSPMQLGWVPLHVPSDWQNRRADPTSTSGARQEKETDER